MSGRVLRGRPRARDLLDLDAEEPGADEQLVADRGIYVAADGLSRQEELLNVGMKKKRVLPSELQDPLGEWLPVPEYGDDEGNEATSSEPAALGKRKEYASTVSGWEVLDIARPSDSCLVVFTARPGFPVATSQGNVFGRGTAT
jgi:hypothetical protein